MTTNSSFLKNDYLGAFQIFKIAKFSKVKDQSDDDIESIMDFWCPMFETISPIKIGFLVVFVVLSGLSSSLKYQSKFEVGYLKTKNINNFIVYTAWSSAIFSPYKSSKPSDISESGIDDGN